MTVKIYKASEFVLPANTLPEELIDGLYPKPACKTKETTDFINALLCKQIDKVKELAYRVPLNVPFVSYVEVDSNVRVNDTPLDFMIVGYDCNYDNDTEYVVDVINVLIEAGADLNLKNVKNGLSPLNNLLFCSVFITEIGTQITKLLLDNGASYSKPLVIDEIESMYNHERDLIEFRNMLDSRNIVYI
jgi:hypothetical protein